jgi:hypothetical protein
MKNLFRILFIQKFFSSNAKNNFNVKPQIKYYNADADKINIFTDNRNKIGVYRWINNLNGKTYIGSSINLSVRFYTYYSLRSLAKSNRPMERALLKYGFSNFSLEILEYCNSEDLLKKEQYYLDTLKPEYNIAEIAGSTLGYKHSEESLKKMRNFILSDEVLAKKKLATKNAITARSIPIIVKNIKTNKISEYVSLSAASNVIGVTKSAISQALINNTIIKKTYILERKEYNNSEDHKG